MKLSAFAKFILNNLFAIIGLALFAYFVINFSYIQYHLANYEEYTFGTIIDFEEDYRGNKIAIFEFEVDNKTFTGQAYFDDFIAPIIGESFTVKFSKKNPKISRMEFR